MKVRKGVRRPARARALAGLGIVGIIAVASLVGGWGVSPVETSEISPADIVALRFPPDWNDDDTTASASPVTFALASVTESRQLETNLLFSPYQSFPQPAKSEVAPPEPQPIAAAEKAAEKPEVKAASTHIVAAAPERRPHVRKESGALFNDAQLASIKARLKLTEYQEQYWPPVASALRDVGVRAAHVAVRKSDARGSQAHAAEIDPNGEEIQRLKSAAFPLIMSMNDEQKREVRMLAQVMGLERVAASF